MGSILALLYLPFGTCWHPPRPFGSFWEPLWSLPGRLSSIRVMFASVLGYRALLWFLLVLFRYSFGSAGRLSSILIMFFTVSPSFWFIGSALQDMLTQKIVSAQGSCRPPLETPSWRRQLRIDPRAPALIFLCARRLSASAKVTTAGNVASLTVILVPTAQCVQLHIAPSM